MSLWFCECHRLHGPETRCPNASRVEVPGTTQSVTVSLLPAVPPEEWIEAMAIAIRRQGFPDSVAWSMISDKERGPWLRDAHAAYAALREAVEK